MFKYNAPAKTYFSIGLAISLAFFGMGSCWKGCGEYREKIDPNSQRRMIEVQRLKSIENITRDRPDLNSEQILELVRERN